MIDPSDQVLLAVDPGIDRCGAAVFDRGRLVWAALPKTRYKGSKDNRVLRAVAMAEAALEAVQGASVPLPDRLVVEWPRVYMPGRSRGDNNDLLLLTAVDGALACEIAGWSSLVETTMVFPDEWKGQAPDHVVQGRVFARLRDAGPVSVDGSPELAVLAGALERVAEKLRHNVTDAVGIGLHALGRFQQGVIL